jgi:replicative DNA helicase
MYFKVMETIIINIEDKEKSKAIKTMLKALKVNFKAHEKIAQDNIDVAEGIRRGFEEVKLIQSGKLKPQTFEQLLDEV